MTKSTNARARESAMFASPIERVLHALGATAAFTDGVLGDMAEEHERCKKEHGSFIAALCYLREAIRSAPFFLANALRYGSAGDRVRLSLFLGGVALLVTLATVSVVSGEGPAARLVANADNSNSVVVNNRRPVRLEMRVLDAAGRLLKSDGLHFSWLSGVPMFVSSAGFVTCKDDGEGKIRVSLGKITTVVDVECRRVYKLEASAWMDFVVGDSARLLPFYASGREGQQISMLRGTLQVADSSAATLSGSTVRPRAVGRTTVDLTIGEHAARIGVLVHEPVSSFEGLRADQQLVAVSVRLARNDIVHLTLPTGGFRLKYIARREEEPPPSIQLAGSISCTPDHRLSNLPRGVYSSYCIVHSAGAKVMLAHGDGGLPVVDGVLALDRSDQ